MTRHSAHLPRDARRDLERRLGEIPTPPPPADLLERIRAEIPADLAPANPPTQASKAWHRRPLVRLAASLAIVAVGLAIALRVAERQERPSSDGLTGTEGAPVIAETRPLPRPAPSTGRTVAEIPAPAPQQKPLARSARDATSDSLSVRAKKVPAPLVSDSAYDVPPAAREQQSEAGAGSRIAAVGAAPSGARREMEERLRRQDESAGRVAGESAALPEPSAKIVVTGDSPLLDASKVAANASASSDLQKLPSARARRVAEEPAHGVAVTQSNAAPPSTGGTAEPLDQPVGDMFYRPVGTNPFVDTAEDHLSTFALDVDTGSWTLARSYLERGALPPVEAIRVEEFVNAQRYDDPAPRRGDFSLVAEGAPSPFAPAGDYRLLRFAVKAREISESQRRPANLTFVIDVSGSMDRENRLGLVKRALGLLLDELRPDDRVALVVFGSRGRVLLAPTHDHEAIRDAISWLRPEGSTNAEEGLRLGYDVADRAFRADATNRIVLCSDGVANVGATGPESILARIGHEARRGIELTTIGFGMGNYNDALMEQLADQGDGSYHYVDSLDEARRVFVDELTGALETVARDAKVQVEFDPAVVERWRLVGYENRDVADRDFRNDRVDAGELGSGHSATALYEIRLAPRARRGDRLATLRLRWKSTATGRVEEAALDLHVHDLALTFRSASDDLRKAALAAELAEMLKHSFYAREASWSSLAGEARVLQQDRRRDPELGELRSLIDRASALSWRQDAKDDSDERH